MVVSYGELILQVVLKSLKFSIKISRDIFKFPYFTKTQYAYQEINIKQMKQQISSKLSNLNLNLNLNKSTLEMNAITVGLLNQR